MTDERGLEQGSADAGAPMRKRGERQDDLGRAFAGSQMNLQVWVNRRQPQISAAIMVALGIVDPGAHLQWESPLEKPDPGRQKGFSEYRDGAFLRALGLEDHHASLKKFWPKGGPVWDGLARIVRPGSDAIGYVLVEAKSYPGEVFGGGCKAIEGSRSHETIAESLAATSLWLGLSAAPESWMGKLYQSANRIAHVYFLREQLGLEAYMVNVCFTGDPHRNYATTAAQWDTAKRDFRVQLGLLDVETPWLVDVVLPAASRDELRSPSAAT